MRKTSKLSLVAIAVMVCLSIACLSTFAYADVPASTPSVIEEEGWNGYNATSTIERTNNGMTMGGDAAAYGFSYTSKETFAARELSINLRVNNHKFEAGIDSADIIIGLETDGKDFMSTDGSSYGVALLPTAVDTYAMWFVKRDSSKTAVPGFEHIANVPAVKLSASGSLNILFHREAADHWMIMANGAQISITGAANSAHNAVLEALTDVNIAVAARNSYSVAGAQTMKVDVVQVGGKILGDRNDSKSVTFTENRIGSTPVFEDAGISFNSAKPIRASMPDDLKGKLDGYTMSVTIDSSAVSAFSLDIGVGTYHESGRFTFWDSNGDHPAVASSFGLRMTHSNDMVFLSIAAGNVESQTIGAGLKYSNSHNNTYVLSINKVDENWHVYMNGRMLVSSGDSDVYQARMNATFEALNISAAVSPWISVGDFGETNTGEFKLRLNGFGSRTVGLDYDPAEGVVGDEIDGKLEFSTTNWVGTTPPESTVDYKITNDGFSFAGINRVTGFSIGMHYNQQITDLDGYEITFKMPETVRQSSGATHGYYGMYIGNSNNKNFTEQDSIVIRWTYGSEKANTSPNIQIINWKKDDAAAYQDSSANAPVKTVAGKETEVTIRFAFNEKTEQYRIYANGARVSSPTVEAAITSLISGMSDKYFYAMSSYETDGVGGAWGEDDNEKQQYTLISLGGKKLVNEVPDVVQGIVVESTNITVNSCTLNWTKAEYANGYMDSFNFVPTGYIIERLKGESNVIDKTITITDINTISFTDTELEAKQNYFYTVYAVDASGNKLIRSVNKRVTTLAAQTAEPTPEKKGCKGMAHASIPGGIAVALISASALLIVVRKRKSNKSL